MCDKRLQLNIILKEAFQKCRQQCEAFSVGYWKMEIIQVTELSYANNMVELGNTEDTIKKTSNSL